MHAATGMKAVLGMGLTVLAVTAAAAAGPAKEPLFREAKQAYEAAETARADFFAPRSYDRAVKAYRDAERAFLGGRDPQALRAELKLATEAFASALAASRAAQAKLAAPLKARADAERVKAPLYAGDAWQRAERQLARAISDLEREALESAGQRAAEADQLYRDAELATIKNTHLGEVRLAIEQAEKERVGRYAPKTLQRAKDLLAQAERAIEQNRYDADLPRNLVRQASNEVKHARYLAELVKKTRDEKQTAEDLILEWEVPLRQIAGAADMTASFERGYEEPAKKVISYIEEQRERSQRLEQDNSELEAQTNRLRIDLAVASEERATLAQRLEAQGQRRAVLEQRAANLQDEIARLQQSLGGASEERVALAESLANQTKVRESLELEAATLRREIEVLEQLLDNVSKERELLAKSLEAQTRMREQLGKIEGLFSRDEARVLRQYNDVIIRLVGLNFPVGSATIEPKSFALLAKLGQAITAFPGSDLVVEGHTDSYGSDSANLTLSKKRAEAVRQYLVANLKVEGKKVEAVGYGETRPVANNETEEGRARNRRIDVVIRPPAEPR